MSPFFIRVKILCNKTSSTLLNLWNKVSQIIRVSKMKKKIDHTQTLTVHLCPTQPCPSYIIQYYVILAYYNVMWNSANIAPFSTAGAGAHIFPTSFGILGPYNAALLHNVIHYLYRMDLNSSISWKAKLNCCNSIPSRFLPPFPYTKCEMMESNFPNMTIDHYFQAIVPSFLS